MSTEATSQVQPVKKRSLFLKVVLGLAVMLLVVIASVLLLATTKPNEMNITRSTTIQAPAGAAFPLVNDFHAWNGWSPYEKLDPQMKRTFSGAESGQGAVYEWDGNANVGQGRMEILESKPNEKVLIQLDFLRPMEGHNQAEFDFKEQPDGTQVSWTMRGPATFLSKVMMVFIDFDQMIGKDFESGLAALKEKAEGGAASSAVEAPSESAEPSGAES